MKNKLLTDAAQQLTDAFRIAYGFCGVLDSPNMMILNSTDEDGRDFTVKFEEEEDD